MKKFKKSRRPEGPRDSRARFSPAKQGGTVVPRGRVVVGIHATIELLNVRPRAVTHLWLRDRYQDHPDLAKIFEAAKRAGIRVETKPSGALDKVASVHQGVVAFASENPEINWSELESSKHGVLLALDEVEDPHNLGAVMRSAWLFEAQGILLPEHRSADLSPAVSKVAQGAVEHVPLEKDNALPQQLERLKKMGYWVLGLSHKGKQDIFQLEIPDKVVWVLGSESSGLRKSVEGVCDDLVRIPQSNPDASFNVSVAAAIALSETYRQKVRTTFPKGTES